MTASLSSRTAGTVLGMLFAMVCDGTCKPRSTGSTLNAGSGGASPISTSLGSPPRGIGVRSVMLKLSSSSSSNSPFMPPSSRRGGSGGGGGRSVKRPKLTSRILEGPIHDEIAVRGVWPIQAGQPALPWINNPKGVIANYVAALGMSVNYETVQGVIDGRQLWR